MSKGSILGARKGLWLSALGCVLSLALVGCGGGGSSVSGKVTYQGKEVDGGSVTFTPVAADSAKNVGKPAGGKVENGKYKLADPLAAGKVRVTYTAPQASFPEGKDPKPGDEPPKSPYAGLVPKDSEVTVKAGSNTVDIDLVAPGAAGAGGK